MKIAVLESHERTLSALWRRAPRWLRLLVAAAIFVVGVVTVLRPTTSLGVLALLIGAGLILQGILELADSAGRYDEKPRLAGLTYVVSVLWVAAGIFVLVFPGLTVGLVAVIVSVGLIASGLLSIAHMVLRPRTEDTRIADGAFGIASIVFGALALAWPDITLLIVSFALGARLMLGAVSVGWQTVRPQSAVAARPGPIRRRARTTFAVVTVIASVALGLVSGALHEGTVPVDDFYAAPREVPDAPGQLIRAEPSTRGVPSDARAWRILYTTTRGDGSPATASGIVVVPKTGDGSWPVIGWNHGTTGFAQTCAPSLLDQPFESGALFTLSQVIEQGWSLVATDYIGLGTTGPHPYLIGKDSAHASLDAIRAARELQQADVGDQTVIWGHSQGGGAAL